MTNNVKRVETFRELVEAIRTLDSSAAEYIEALAVSDEDTQEAVKFASTWEDGSDVVHLDELLVWCDTPQDHDYWSALNAKLVRAGYYG